ncbi:MAG: sulfotransferase domain-containing protein [Verrucomicrobiota bacterium]
MKGVPNLYVPAFGKCGTTTLASVLSSHSGIEIPDMASVPWRCTDKESHFYTRPDFAKQRLERCVDVYPGVAAYRLDATPSYFWQQESLIKIRELAEAPKIIVIIRDPVESTFSLWNHFQRALRTCDKKELESWKGFHPELSLEDHVDQMIAGKNNALSEIGKRSFFLSGITAVFQAEQVKVCFLENMQRDFSAFYRDLFDWLELPDCPVNEVKLNSFQYSFIPNAEVTEKLTKFFDPWNKKLKLLLDDRGKGEVVPECYFDYQ